MKNLRKQRPKALRPRCGTWIILPDSPRMKAARPEGVKESISWTTPEAQFVVMSDLIWSQYPKGTGSGLQWHISISLQDPPRRPPTNLCMEILATFGMPHVEEDNHHPGVARHYFCPLDPSERVDCECKESEETIVEPDGYKWQNAKDPAECRGCEYEAMTGKSCKIHNANSPSLIKTAKN